MNIEKIIPSNFRFQNLLVWIFLYILASPILKTVPHAHLIVQTLFTAMLFSAVYTIHQKIRIMWPTLALLLLTTGLLWSNTLGLLQISEKAIDGLLVTYLGLLVFFFGRYIFTAKEVDIELISAALCLYLLLAMLWAALFMLLEEYIPGSFSGSELPQGHTFRQEFQYFNYLSFITITTLGYGDITPQTPTAMALCQVEAILGHFFTAVLVARLVGIQVAQSFAGQKE
ncbi:MAG: two pore domain potassium channel family protein [Deltaproteobacteria bacterium]|nr:two pore domain potassium channel family protein [Candidatus Tharpella sp.]